MASQAEPELGTAQSQLVLFILLSTVSLLKCQATIMRFTNGKYYNIVATTKLGNFCEGPIKPPCACYD